MKYYSKLICILFILFFITIFLLFLLKPSKFIEKTGVAIVSNTKTNNSDSVNVGAVIPIANFLPDLDNETNNIVEKIHIGLDGITVSQWLKNNPHFFKAYTDITIMPPFESTLKFTQNGYFGKMNISYNADDGKINLINFLRKKDDVINFSFEEERIRDILCDLIKLNGLPDEKFFVISFPQKELARGEHIIFTWFIDESVILGLTFCPIDESNIDSYQLSIKLYPKSKYERYSYKYVTEKVIYQLEEMPFIELYESALKKLE